MEGFAMLSKAEKSWWNSKRKTNKNESWSIWGNPEKTRVCHGCGFLSALSFSGHTRSRWPVPTEQHQLWPLESKSTDAQIVGAATQISIIRIPFSWIYWVYSYSPFPFKQKQSSRFCFFFQISTTEMLQDLHWRWPSRLASRLRKLMHEVVEC